MNMATQTETWRELRDKLLEHKILVASGVPGVFGRSATFERVIAGLQAAITRVAADDGAEVMRFAPVLPRQILRQTGYMENFPHLCGSVHAFAGDNAQHAALVERVKAGGDWTPFLAQTDVALTPAACYPLYPTLRGRLPVGGRLFDVTGDCFRHEPSDDPARMQSFRMRENIRVGAPQDVIEWRAKWIERGQKLLTDLGLAPRRELASDPFFGRGGKLMKTNQAALELKFEMLVTIASEDAPTAVASFNYHQDHFGKTFGIEEAGGGPAHTACMGFGLERVVLALFVAHGLDTAKWPAAVKRELFS